MGEAHLLRRQDGEQVHQRQRVVQVAQRVREGRVALAHLQREREGTVRGGSGAALRQLVASQRTAGAGLRHVAGGVGG
jgi:hypothetical protein